MTARGWAFAPVLLLLLAVLGAAVLVAVDPDQASITRARTSPASGVSTKGPALPGSIKGQR